MRKLTGIIIHASATRPDWMRNEPLSAKVAEIKKWHVVDNGWRDIGYHFIIDRDGQMQTGRPITEDGAHVAGHNTGTIGVCLLGGHGSTSTDDFFTHFTKNQDVQLRTLIDNLRNKYGQLPISGHNEYAAKACPGFDVRSWFGGGEAEPDTDEATLYRWRLKAIMEFAEEALATNGKMKG